MTERIESPEHAGMTPRRRVAAVFGGLAIGMMYALLPLATGLLTGWERASRAAFASYGVSLGQAIAIYLLSGLSAGAVLAIVTPRMPSRGMCYFVSILSTTIGLLPIWISVNGPLGGWSSWEWVPLLLFGSVAGAVAATQLVVPFLRPDLGPPPR